MPARVQSQRNERLAEVSKESGVFVYTGESVAIEHSPTQMRMGANVAVLDATGMPVMDRNGEQVFEKAGRPLTNEDGTPKLGGVPKATEIKLNGRTVFDVEFPAGKPVEVKNPKLAQKLRCMAHFKEVTGGKVEIEESADLSTLEGLLTLSKKELLAKAESLGIAVDATHNKAELAEAILANKQ